jgi:hypothetical protein
MWYYSGALMSIPLTAYIDGRALYCESMIEHERGIFRHVPSTSSTDEFAHECAIPVLRTMFHVQTIASQDH